VIPDALDPLPPPAVAPARHTPSISRLFVAAFLAIAVAGLADRYATWRSARDTQAAMVDLTRHLQEMQQRYRSRALGARIQELQDIADEAGDDAIQAAAATTVIFGVILVALAVGLWYNRRRLEQPFAYVVSALERVAGGHYDERLDETQPEEFGIVAEGVNRMAAALAGRERMQAQVTQLLVALHAPPGDGGSFDQALSVLAATTGARALVLYQPQYDTNEWAPTALRGTRARPLARTTVREVVGDAARVLQFAGPAADPIRARLQLDGGAADRLALLPLRARERLVGLVLALFDAELTPDAHALLETTAPNLAFACERESAHQQTRRLATEVRLSAQRLESQNATLEEQHSELTRLNAELDRTNRAKDQFLANVSHELRTPLNSIIGFSELLLMQDTGALTEPQRDFIETVARNGRHLLQLISELLDLSKIAAGRLELAREPLALDAVLREAADSVHALVEAHHHTLALDLPAASLTVSADRTRVRQVLLNLLSNAIKFTPDGGRVTLGARLEDGDRGVRLWVTDNGIGIAPADHARLFQEFVQLDASPSRRFEGTGLGLALCKRMVELHGGTIGVESALGRGSTFWFTLPQATPQPESA